jgi:hypothetical protein
MKYKFFCTLGFMVLAVVGFAASTAGAATTAAGPYYANPSWDQQLPASTRFVALSNWIDAAHPSGGAAVLDRETGLVWEQSPDTTSHTWVLALVHCNTLSTGGRLGWRLPTVQELASLVDNTVPFPGPTLPPGHPFSTQGFAFWSATVAAADTGFAWDVGFSSGSVGSDLKTTLFGIKAWCVRGGQGPDEQ